MNTEIQQKLTRLAYKRSKPFCYNDYIECPDGRCSKCGSDDLMRLVPGVGCEYGTDWVVEHILETELEPVDMNAAFEDMIRECYPETTKVGWLELDTVSVLKEMDPVAWRSAQSEWESQEAEARTIISLDNGGIYYRHDEIEDLLESEE